MKSRLSIYTTNETSYTNLYYLLFTAIKITCASAALVHHSIIFTRFYNFLAQTTKSRYIFSCNASVTMNEAQTLCLSFPITFSTFCSTLELVLQYL